MHAICCSSTLSPANHRRHPPLYHWNAATRDSPFTFPEAPPPTPVPSRCLVESYSTGPLTGACSVLPALSPLVSFSHRHLLSPSLAPLFSHHKEQQLHPFGRPELTAKHKNTISRSSPPTAHSCASLSPDLPRAKTGRIRAISQKRPRRRSGRLYFPTRRLVQNLHPFHRLTMSAAVAMAPSPAPHERQSFSSERQPPSAAPAPSGQPHNQSSSSAQRTPLVASPAASAAKSAASRKAVGSISPKTSGQSAAAKSSPNGA